MLATILGRWLNNTYPFAVRGHYVAVVCLNPVPATTTDDGVGVSLGRVDGVVATPSDQEVISALAASRSDFLCSGLLRVAPYCAPGGIRVVSILPCIRLTLSCTSSSCIHIGQALPHAIDW